MSLLDELELAEEDREPKPDIAICSECGRRFAVADCPTELDGCWEYGYFDVHVCPHCPNGGCIDDYEMTEERSKEWSEWMQRNKPERWQQLFDMEQEDEHR